MTALKVTEKDFHKTVEDLLAVLGYLSFSVRNSYQRVSARGFPDIVACHPVTGALVFLELKSAKGKVTDEQREWVNALNANAYHERRAWIVYPDEIDWWTKTLAALAGKTIT